MQIQEDECDKDERDKDVGDDQLEPRMGPHTHTVWQNDYFILTNNTCLKTKNNQLAINVAFPLAMNKCCFNDKDRISLPGVTISSITVSDYHLQPHHLQHSQSSEYIKGETEH